MREPNVLEVVDASDGLASCLSCAVSGTNAQAAVLIVIDGEGRLRLASYGLRARHAQMLDAVKLAITPPAGTA